MKVLRPLLVFLLVIALSQARVEAQQPPFTARQIIAAGVLIVGGVVLIAILAHAMSHKTTRTRPEPCSPTIAPIRDTTILITVYNTYTYTLRDPTSKDTDAAWILDRLNADGAVDRNHFALANGQAGNFTLTFTFNSDPSNHFSGSLRFSGWGQGYITTLDSGPNVWVRWYDMTDNLVDQAYGYIHGGWHDSRPGCAGREESASAVTRAQAIPLGAAFGKVRFDAAISRQASSIAPQSRSTLSFIPPSAGRYRSQMRDGQMAGRNR